MRAVDVKEFAVVKSNQSKSHQSMKNTGLWRCLLRIISLIVAVHGFQNHGFLSMLDPSA